MEGTKQTVKSAPVPENHRRLEERVFKFCDKALTRLVEEGCEAFIWHMPSNDVTNFQREIRGDKQVSTEMRNLVNALVSVNRGFSLPKLSPDQMYARMCSFLAAFDTFCKVRDWTAVSAYAAVDTWGE